MSDSETHLHYFKELLRIRVFEQRVGELFVRGQSAGSMLHLSIGEEAAACGVGFAMKAGDTFTTHHRGHGIFLARGADPKRMMAEIAGRRTGYCKGKGGSMHIADATLGHLGANAIVGGGIPTVVGAGLSYECLGKNHVSVAFFGDGAMQQGILYESMNLAALWKLPVMFVCVNNQYGMATRIDHASASLEFGQRAKTFGLDGREIDGTDIAGVHEVAVELIRACRNGQPCYLAVDCYRFHGHARLDKSPYRSEEEERLGRQRDPVAHQKQFLLDQGLCAQEALREIENEVEAEMDAALTYALGAPEPERKSMFEDVYAVGEPSTRTGGPAMMESSPKSKEVTYRDALRSALEEEMARDSTVVLIGEEVGRYGGAYGVTRGLLERFGEQRVFDTPISEAAIVGAAIGAAMTGLRPVVELMYVDFVALAMDQIANQAAKIRYMFGGQLSVPMVLRTQGGTGRSAGAQHSQSLEAWIMHTPGLRLAMPATVTDAHCLLREAIRSPDPVVFIEHKSLYTSKAPIDPDEALPWGRAAVRRRGRDATLVTYSRMLTYAVEAALKLENDDIGVDVIDLRTLNPLDMDTVIQSVNKTKRAVVVTEDSFTAGVSGELAARIGEACFHTLAEPVVRVAAHDIPIPVAPALEQAAIPSVEDIETAVRRIVKK